MANEKNKYEEFKGFSDPEKDRSVLFDSRGAKKTQTLFVDVNNNKKYTPIYTMRDQDYKGCLSAYQVYMHCVDETEAALKLLGSLDHWTRLMGLQWFREGTQFFSGVEQWRKDMQARDEMMAKRTLLDNAKYRGDTSAARTLLQLNKKQEPKTPKAVNKTPEAEAGDEKKNKIAQLHAAKISEDK